MINFEDTHELDDDMTHGAGGDRGGPPTGPGRRDLLRAGLLATGAGILAGALEACGSGHSTGRALPARAPRTAEPSHSVVRAHDGTGLGVSRPRPAAPPPVLPERPAWVSTWKNPIWRIDDYVRRCPDVTYSRNAIMLTIDDGPDPTWTPRYLRLLARHHVQATFCVIGQQVRQHPSLVKAVVDEGHHIGNHTYRHPLGLPGLSAPRIRSELEDTTDAIVRASGFRPRQFRAPGGNWGPTVLAEVSRQEMMPLGWDIDPRDWSLPGVAHIRSAMLATRPHDIILCHDGGGDRSQTYGALATVIPALQARGWSFVTLPAPQSI